MHSSLRGLAVLAAAVALSSCNGDPTESFRGEGRIIADPATIILSRGSSELVEVQLVDDQGNQLAADFAVGAVGPGLTVTKDTTFLPTFSSSRLLTEARFAVEAVAAGATSFTITGGGASLEIPVRVVPTEFAATFSNATPAQNEPVVLTAPAGFTIQPGASVIVGGDTAIVLSQAADGSTITFLPAPGATGPVTVAGVEAGFVPGVALELPTEAGITVGPVTRLAGTGDPSTAPALTIPPEGEATGLFDAGPTAAAPEQYYQFTLGAPADVTVTLNWEAAEAADVNLILCSDAACSEPDETGATDSQPESATYTLTPGTYFILVNLAEGADPTTISLAVSQAAPSDGGA